MTGQDVTESGRWAAKHAESSAFHNDRSVGFPAVTVTCNDHCYTMEGEQVSHSPLSKG